MLTTADTWRTDMSTFDPAARAEFMRRFEHFDGYRSEARQDDLFTVFKSGMQYASEQEPTDAELDALHDAFVAHSGPGREISEFSESCCTECGYAVGWPGREMDGGRRAKRHAARAALSAARAARRDEGHVHAWRWKQNTTSRGFPMTPIEVCPCGAARDARRDEEKR